MNRLLMITLLSTTMLAQAPAPTTSATPAPAKTSAQMDQDNQQLQVQIAALHNQLVKADPAFVQWEQLTRELEQAEGHARVMHYSENVKAHEAARQAAAKEAAAAKAAQQNAPK
jgi:biopolymer transport protein ExbD